MGIFDAAGAAALRGDTITAEILAFFDFRSSPQRVHAGFGTLRAGGFDWQGMGGLGSVSDIESAVGGIAPLVTFTLAGVGPEIANDVVNAKTEVKGRDCYVYLQLYGSDLSPLGGLYTLYRGLMDRLVHTANGPDTWTAQLTAETKFSRRGLPPFGNLTNADQQRRYPGDNGLFDIAQMINRRRPWNPEIPEKSST
ncbi:hypothetical protein [Methylobacterium sp. ARG-1]|uniref:hypothetical protein n=1 Tax=Methylobacterium sp. ARG-1 TaxID=1692501 RepID=UPI0006810FAE|nr:hypothetical protein [Methylobacterium sp. ARG-1]KNY21598.1 hypothetical protein AKJ13_15200 [Methylobacterium sp. ARG-1]